MTDFDTLSHLTRPGVEKLPVLESQPPKINTRYVVKSTTKANVKASSQDVQAETWFKTPPLTAQTIRMIRAVKLFAESHDQGSVGDLVSGNWTWFQLAIFENENSTTPKKMADGQELIATSHANKVGSTKFEWLEGGTVDTRRVFLKALEPNNVIAVRLCARFQGWEIFANTGYLVLDIAEDNSPYPVIPIKISPTEPIPTRRCVRMWYNESKTSYQTGLQVSLFLRALTTFQEMCPENQASYFRIAGIHGHPYNVSWNMGQPIIPIGDPRLNNFKRADLGGFYCRHNDDLFPTWHRRRVSDLMMEEARTREKQPGGWALAAKDWRLPYWDWAAETSLPEIAISEKIEVIKSWDGKQESRPEMEKIDNPMYRFRMPGLKPMGDDSYGDYRIVYNSDKYDFEAPVGTSRHGITLRDAERKWVMGYTDVDKVNRNLKGENNYKRTLKDSVFRLLTQQYATKYVRFASTKYDPDENEKAVGATNSEYLNLEQIHNTIHDLVGGSSVKEGYGHMARPEVAAFDPIFWMHHCNIDRLFHLWQCSNPSNWFHRTRKVGGVDEFGAQEPLKPFHVSYTPGDFWDSNRVRNPDALNYTYDYVDEMTDEFGDIVPEKSNLYINRRYGPDEDAFKVVAPQYDPVINIIYDRYALNGAPYLLLFFLGQPNSQVHWRKQECLIGNVFTFSARFSEEEITCTNCYKQQQQHILSRAQIPMTAVVGNDDRLDRETARNYLEKNLKWTAIDDDDRPVDRKKLNKDLKITLSVGLNELRKDLGMQSMFKFGHYETVKFDWDKAYIQLKCIVMYQPSRTTARQVAREAAFCVAAVPMAPLLGRPLLHTHRRSPTSFHSSTMVRAPEYRWINGVEQLEKYAEGGYHPVEIGHVLDHRYHVVGKLGYGGWSTVWLARDERLGGYVALKVGIADSLPHEVEILRALRAENDEPCAGADAIPRILSEFRVEGPNGSHPCYTTPVALGDLRQTSFSRLFTLPVARALAFELATAVKYVHARGYAHGDIYLDNILVRAPPAFQELTAEQFRRQYGEPELYPVERVDNGLLPPGVPSSAVTSLHMCKHAKEFTLADARLCLTDFGESFAPALGTRLGSDCHTPLEFRPPEALLAPETPLSFSSDIWSLATAIWDIIGMKALFSSFFCSQDEFILRLEDTIGPLPAEWLARWDARADYLYENGERKPGGKKPWWSLEEAFARGVQKDRRELGMGEFGTDEEAAILALMRSMLCFRPEDRKTIDEVLESEWMVKWARPEYERSREVQHGRTRSTPATAEAGFLFSMAPPENPYIADPYFQRILSTYLPKEMLAQVTPALTAFAQETISPQIREWNLNAERQPPFVEKHSVWGARHNVDRLVTSEGWRGLRKCGAPEGTVAIGYENQYGKYNRIVQHAKNYLFSPVSGLTGCPLSMTDGTARLLRAELPNLPASHPFHEAYRGLTARTDQLDIGPAAATSTTPRRGRAYSPLPQKTGAHGRLDGGRLPRVGLFKFFSSATDADVTMLLAKTAASGQLSAFLAPLTRTIVAEDGQRPPSSPTACASTSLKSKLGTRQLPTAELTMTDMRAHLVGPLDRGVDTPSRTSSTARRNRVSATRCGGAAAASAHASPTSRCGVARLRPARASSPNGFPAPPPAARRWRGSPGRAARADGRAAKAVTSKNAVLTMQECIEALGGVGYMDDPDNMARRAPRHFPSTPSGRAPPMF
ncbi:Di-copper centre-containing [Cordyceps militaris]|uniref:Di-copper centre-containing n=1 Tax=Cordyceps militaris TaxID=73501 RepID=A0A2H4SIR8_CORMI|nr:Di-copper centre-containing [Cordyceps militaris]